MEVKSDIEIAQACAIKPIRDIAAVAGVDEEYLEYYGKYKAKIDLKLLDDRADRPDGKLILVTAINPTPAGEGKTTTTVGLADGMRRLGKNTVVALREPSLGPVFGVKGGAAGGGIRLRSMLHLDVGRRARRALPRASAHRTAGPFRHRLDPRPAERPHPRTDRRAGIVGHETLGPSHKRRPRRHRR